MTDEAIAVIRICLKLKRTEVPKDSELLKLIDKALKELDYYTINKRM